MNIPLEASSQIDRLKSQLEDFQLQLSSLISALNGGSTAASTPSHLDEAAARMSLAEAISTLFCTHLRCRGLDPYNLPVVKKELDRVKHFRKKLSKVQAADELSRHRPTITLDVAAANRFIDAAIPNLSKEQHAQLRKASAKAGSAQPQQGAGKRARGESAPVTANSSDTTGARNTKRGKANSKAKPAGSSRDAALHFLQAITEEASREAAVPVGGAAVSDDDSDDVDDE